MDATEQRFDSYGTILVDMFSVKDHNNKGLFTPGRDKIVFPYLSP